MANWSFPIDPIRFTDAEMDRKKAEYVAEHGYEIHLPGITEIVTLWNPSEPTAQEMIWWRQKNYHQLGYSRYNEITRIIQRKRGRYRRMLASPTPTWMTNIASVMTWFDDVNDLLGTAGVVFRTAAFLLPKVAKRFFLGPAGWLFLFADIFGVLLSLTSSLMSVPLHCLSFKRNMEGVRGANPFSTESRQRRARKLTRFRPSMGELIEGLQTTDQVYGRGLCLGPILGAAYDIGFGLYRAATGRRVNIRTLHPALSSYENLAYKTTRHLAALGLAADELTEEDHFRTIMAAYVAQSAIRSTILDWNPLDQVEGLEHMRIPAQGPTHPSTLYTLEEFGIQPGERIGWPFLDKEYVSYDEIWDRYREPLEKSTMDYFVRNRRTELGLIAAQNAKEAGMMAESNIEGTNPLELVNINAFQSIFNYTGDGCPCKVLGSMTAQTGGVVLNRTKQYGEVTVLWNCASDTGAPYFQYDDPRGITQYITSSELCPDMKRWVLPPGEFKEKVKIPSNISAGTAVMPLIKWLKPHSSPAYP